MAERVVFFLKLTAISSLRLKGDRKEERTMTKLYTLTQICEMTGFSRWTLGRWIRQGKGPKFKLSPGGTYLFLVSDVREWITGLGGTATGTYNDQN